MKKCNIVIVFNKDINQVLMCLRTKKPYQGMYNFVGGKLEKEGDDLNEAYRELYEETNISKKDISLNFFMDITYVKESFTLQVYYGILNKKVKLIEEVNHLEWLSLNENFYDLDKFAGEGIIGHLMNRIIKDMEEEKNDKV